MLWVTQLWSQHQNIQSWSPIWPAWVPTLTPPSPWPTSSRPSRPRPATTTSTRRRPPTRQPLTTASSIRTWVPPAPRTRPLKVSYMALASGLIGSKVPIVSAGTASENFTASGGGATSYSAYTTSPPARTITPVSSSMASSASSQTASALTTSYPHMHSTMTQLNAATAPSSFSTAAGYYQPNSADLNISNHYTDMKSASAAAAWGYSSPATDPRFAASEYCKFSHIFDRDEFPMLGIWRKEPSHRTLNDTV